MAELRRQGSTCLREDLDAELLEEAGALFSGDTLCQGGPGATGRSFSDFPTVIEAIRARLLALPAETGVNTGHGESTTIGAKAPPPVQFVILCFVHNPRPTTAPDR